MAGVRRTWDKEKYEARAKERAEMGDDAVPSIGAATSSSRASSASASELKEEFRPAAPDADGPMGSERAFLKAREGTIDLDSKVGKIEVINPTTIEGAKAPGFFCEVCMCLLKDSASYLDHINGKKHQRALGYGMRVEKAGVDQVKNRIEMLKRKVNEATVPAASAVDDYNARLALQAAEAERLKRQKKEQAAARKREEEEAELEQMDPEIAAMMGFGGFGSKNK